MLGKPVTELTVTEYRNTGLRPSVRTIINNLDSWTNATSIAAEEPQHIPSTLPQYYRAVAALRRARDIGGHPVTGLKYQNRLDIPVSYHEVLSPFPSWTQAKIVARVHTPGDEPYEGIKSMQERVE